jgi:hypothetical protein
MALLLAGCAQRGPQSPARAAVSYPYSAAAPRVFYATQAGLAEAPAGDSVSHNADTSGAQAAQSGSQSQPAYRAPNASVLSSDGRSITVAVNGWGVACIEQAARIEQAKGGAAYRLVGSALPGLFTGLTTGGAWPTKDGTLVQLYRDPFAENTGTGTPSAATTATPTAVLPASSRLVLVSGEQGLEAKAVDPIENAAGAGYELFALLPSGGAWYAELRKDAAERVDLKFLAFNELTAGPGGDAAENVSAASARIREIHRSDFEAALKPRPLASLTGDQGKALSLALAALGPHPWLVRLRGSAGEDAWLLSSGSPEDALPVYAWADGQSVAAIRQDGWLAVANAEGGRSLSRISPPREGAGFTALAVAGELMAAAWESGDFPNVEAAGLVVAYVAPPEKRDTISK